MWMGVMGRRTSPLTRSEGLQVEGVTGNSILYTLHPTLLSPKKIGTVEPPLS